MNLGMVAAGVQCRSGGKLLPVTRVNPGASFEFVCGLAHACLEHFFHFYYANLRNAAVRNPVRRYCKSVDRSGLAARETGLCKGGWFRYYQ